MNSLLSMVRAHAFWLWTILFSFIGAAITMAIGMAQSVWFDEAYSILVAQQPLDEILYLASVDTHPPLYYLLLGIWGDVFGWSEFALRSLSVLAFGGTVFVAMVLMRRLFDTRTALLAGGLLIVAPLVVRYGFEIRMYSLAMLIGVSATYVLVRARESGRTLWWWAAYSVLIALGLGTLYYLAFLWIAHLVWLVVIDRQKWREWYRASWVWSYLAGAALFLPQLPTFAAQVNNGALAAIGQPMNLEQLMGVISFNTVYKPLWQVSVPETVLVVAVIAIAIQTSRIALIDRKNREAVMLLLAYWAVPIIVLMVISLGRPMYVERYLSHTAVGLVLWMAAVLSYTVASKRSRRSFAIYGSVFAVCALGLLNIAQVGNFNFQRMQRPAVDQAVASIGVCKDTTIVAADPYVATELSYYVPAECVTLFYSETAELGGGYAPFSNSPDRLTSTYVNADTPRLHYLYYGEPLLEIDDSYRNVVSSEFGGMKVAEYEAVR